ncbi:MAG: sulfite exporter TauE/SafE family protein [Bauldia sp.]
MQIYLPIAELSVNMLIIFGMGGAVGFLSGLFGVGGGFLLTPLLIFSGIPPVVSVATVSSQIVASSASGALSYWRRRMIDMKLAMVLLFSGIVGTAIGVFVFNGLRKLGQLDLIVSLAYVTFLGSVGGLMLTESVRAIIDARHGRPAPLRRPGQHNWIHGLPFKMRFKRSKLYVSAIPIVALGIAIGFLGALLGIGGGFIMVPALIYLLRVPTNVVIGTSLVQIVGTMAVATVLHAVGSQSVDAVLAVILMIGGVIGAQFGARVGQNIRGDQLRALLALLVLAVAIRFLIGLVVPPDERFTLELVSGGFVP